MALGNYRHDERPDLPAELPGSQTLILARLDDAEVAKLSQAMLGEAASSPHIVSLLTQETEGNTFFIVEVMHALAEESGSLDTIGKMTLPKDVFTQGMQRILQRRIQQVPADDQALLRLAAVAGRRLDWQLLALWADARQLEEWLQTCAEVAILSLRDETWFFAHDKLRETIIVDLQAEEHPRLHRQVAEAIEQVYPDDANYDEALLEHWHRAGNLDKEIHYLKLVARHLIEIAADYERARVLLERGLQMLPETDVRSVALRNWLAASHERQGQYDQAQTQAQKARQLAIQLKNQPGLALALYHLGNVVYRQADYGQARNYYQQSLAIYKAIDDQPGIATSFNHLGIVAYRQGDYGQAWDYNQQSLIIRQYIGDQRGIALSLIGLGIVAYSQGDYAQAQDYGQQSFGIYQAIGDQWGTAFSLNNLGMVAYRQGDYGQARENLQQSLSISYDIGDQFGTAYSFNYLGNVAYRQGDYVQAQNYYQQSLSIAYSIPAIPHLLLSLSGFAWLYLQGAEPARAGELCGLAQHHPATDSDVQIRLDELLPQLAEALSPADLQAALERGKSLDLDTVVAELLVEFGETDG
ncbi:MAG: tetratricopeptide repeat protein [Gammaproteobacteria bacterium]|nr:tetratricopeptide repeat protein [Gammaproteobacteria bacterium]